MTIPNSDVGPVPIPKHFLEQPPSTSTMMLEKSGSMMQSFKPISNICSHLSAFHPYHDDRGRHVEAHHFCSHLSDDFIQCLIYDAHDVKTARLIGVEYVISKALLEQLPTEERQYWHPHAYEVKAGLLINDGVPGVMEDQMMKWYANSYGKTWHFWQVDRGDMMPFGPAKLMSTYYDDGQLPLAMIQKRDARTGSDTGEKKERRKDIICETLDQHARA
jgi:Protein of unknown function (DUF1264)